MNKEWSELNKTMQQQIKKKETFSQGIDTLLVLRKRLMQQMLDFRDTLMYNNILNPKYIPQRIGNGLIMITVCIQIRHSAESITLIRKDEQIFFAGEYQKI